MEKSLPEHFCILPWVHLYITHEGDVLPCSKHSQESTPYANIKIASLKSAWESQRAEEFRESMLAGKPSPLCYFCNQVAKSGAHPYRHYENLKFKHVKPVGKTKPIFLEIRFSNLCNLKCRTCDPGFSTKWYSEGRLVYNQSYDKPLNAFRDREHFENFLNESLSDIEVLHIMGGEPLIQDEFYILLEKLISLGKNKIKISVTTNFTKIRHKKWDFVELSRQFPNMHIMASFDGADAQAEFIRKGCDWKEIEQNFKSFIERGGGNINIYPVISVLNSFHITKAIDRWLESGIISERAKLCIPNFVTEKPKYYNIRILNSAEREKLKTHYKLYLIDLETRVTKSIFQNVKEYLNYVLKFLDGGVLPEELRAEFRRVTKVLDQSRKESFPELFPELSSLEDQ